MGPDAAAFLEEERAAWRPFEVLANLTDAQLSTPVEACHGWRGRQLMAHLLSGHEIALAVATELMADDTSVTRERFDADWDARGGDAVNAEIDAAWAVLPLDEVRERFDTLPELLRRALVDVPATRWFGDDRHRRFFEAETTAHDADHVADLQAMLAAAGR